ncbi:MAG: hypothetical protein MUD12_07855 [Spirochaetes bacterium]|jgi:long-chain fatty acid transport protein|nr:hypothetical protein [Spirochaetota bacterium]
MGTEDKNPGRGSAVIISASIMLVLVSAFSPGVLFAGSIEENTSQSAEYVKTLSRNASTDTDAVFFNPAGTAFMSEGTHVYFSGQWIYIPIEVNGPSLTRTVYRGEKTSYFLPDLFLVKKMKNTDSGGGPAFSFGLMPIGGGGFGKYKNGLSYIDNTLFLIRGILNSFYPYTLGPYFTSTFKGSSAYYSCMTNAACSFPGGRIALSLGYRFIYGSAFYDAKLYSNGIMIPLGGDFHARQDGVAHGVIAGISAKPADPVTIGFKFEYNSPLVLKTKASGYMILGAMDSSLRDGGAAHRQIPMNANLGVSYRFYGFQISFSSSYYFNRIAQWNGREKSFNNGYEFAAGMDYTFGGLPLNIGFGYDFCYGGARPSGQNQVSELPNGHTFGTGVSYAFDQTLKLTLGFGYIYWRPIDINRGTVLRFLPASFHKRGFVLALGVEHKII